MTAAHRPRQTPAGGEHAPRLTIGEVLGTLREDFPDVTISKIRYLESEDLVHPQRTPSGYRKFSTADVARLRYVLAAQRDHYLPLKVIKEHLDALDRGEAVPGPESPSRVTGQPPVPGSPAAGATTSAPPATAAPEPAAPAPAEVGVEDATAGEPMTAEEFARAAGLDAGLLADCVQYGLLSPGPDGRHPASDLPVARAAGQLGRHGIEARHLRVYRSGAEREVSLVEQIVSPALRARSEDARARAVEQARELSALSAQLHAALFQARLREVLGPDLGG